MKKDAEYFKNLQYAKRIVEDYLRRTNQTINNFKVTAMVAIIVDELYKTKKLRGKSKTSKF